MVSSCFCHIGIVWCKRLGEDYIFYYRENPLKSYSFLVFLLFNHSWMAFQQERWASILFSDHIWTRWLTRFKSTLTSFMFLLKFICAVKLICNIYGVSQVLIGCVAVAMVEKDLLHREQIDMHQYICFVSSQMKLIISLGFHQDFFVKYNDFDC